MRGATHHRAMAVTPGFALDIYISSSVLKSKNYIICINWLDIDDDDDHLARQKQRYGAADQSNDPAKASAKCL